MAKKKVRQLICDTHDEIDTLGTELETLGNDMKEMTFEELRLLPRRLVKMGKEIQKLAYKAKDSGIHMENRMYEYYNAIESLGFTRVKE